MTSQRRSAISDHITLLLLDPDTDLDDDPGPSLDWAHLPAEIS